MLTTEQAQQIKSHLLGQLENFPEENRNMIKHKILSMTKEELEEFVKQNSLSHLENPSENSEEKNCIFCKILDKKINSYKILEDQENLAILEINPLSKGHVLVLPKKHLTEKVPESTENLAKEVAILIESKLKPNQIEISPNNLFGHNFMEVIPLFGDEKERKKATEAELKEVQEILTKKQEIVIEKKSRKRT
jgi:histidine triad (HIT) family protein